MEAFVKRMIDEHKELVVRRNKLANFIYNNDEAVDKYEYATMSIQLNAMETYINCLEVRLVNHGIVVEEGTYFEDVSKQERFVNNNNRHPDENEEPRTQRPGDNSSDN